MAAFVVAEANRNELGGESQLATLIAAGRTVMINRASKAHLTEWRFSSGDVMTMPSLEEAQRNALAARAPRRPPSSSAAAAAPTLTPLQAEGEEPAPLIRRRGNVPVSPPEQRVRDSWDVVMEHCSQDETKSCRHFVGADGKLQVFSLYLEGYNRKFDVLNMQEDELCDAVRKHRAPDPTWMKASTAFIKSNPKYLQALAAHKDDSVNMNTAIIAPRKADQGVLENAQNLREAIQSGPPVSGNDFVVFRGNRRPEEFDDNYDKRTSIYTLEGFASTSLSSVVGLSYSDIEGEEPGIFMVITIPVGSKALWAGNIPPTGTPTDEPDLMESEAELTLSHGSKFRVDEIQETKQWGYAMSTDPYTCGRKMIRTVYLTLLL